MYYVGKLDKNIYSCIAQDIAADEVIITDERILHIKERHPDDFEKYCAYITDAIEAPDYIIEANKPKSALILKAFSENGKKFKMILRLKTSSDQNNIKATPRKELSAPCLHLFPSYCTALP